MRTQSAETWMAVGLFLLTSCGGGGKSSSGPPQQPPQQQPGAVSVADFPYSVVVPPFAVRITASRTSGVPGTVFALAAQVTGNDAPIAEYSWKSSNGLTGSGSTLGAQFAAPGDYLLDVTARDGQGRTATAGTYLRVFNPAATAQVAKTIAPDQGVPGVVVRLTSPALAAPAPHFTISIPGAAALEVFRADLGAATFLVPPDAGVASGAAAPSTSCCAPTGSRSSASPSPSPRRHPSPAPRATSRGGSCARCRRGCSLPPPGCRAPFQTRAGTRARRPS